MTNTIQNLYLIYLGNITVPVRLALFSGIIADNKSAVIPYVWKDISLQAQILYNEFKDYVEIQR